MSYKYVYPKEAVPEMNYKGPRVPKKRCGNCKHSKVTNAGAIIPGLECRIMVKLFKEKGYKQGTNKQGKYVLNMTQVDAAYGTCDLHELSKKRK